MAIRRRIPPVPRNDALASIAERRSVPARESMTDPEVRFTSPRYTVERELGRGGMGIVLLARDHSLDRLVAIKFLPPALAAQDEFRERFLREVRTAASLSHPNIVPIFSVEEHEGNVFYAMGYVDGETLTQRVRRTGPLTPPDAARILQEAAWALGYAHGRGIVHRDVKPDNIMIERASGRAFITDFGIARVANSATMTGVGETLGTPHFMSPEQAAGEPLDARSDIYSLGIAGYYALTGTMPFDAPTVQAILAMHLTKPAPPVASMRAGVPPLFADAIDRCLAKDPALRYESGEALVTAIQGAHLTRAEIAAPVKMFQRVAETSVMQVMTVAFMLIVIGTQAGRAPIMLPLVLVVFLLVMVFQLRSRARALLEQGFWYEDVRAAFVDEQRERERADDAMHDMVRPKPGMAGIVGIAIGVALVIGGMAVGIPSTRGSWQNYAAKVMLVAGVAIAMIALLTTFATRLRVGSRYAAVTTRLWLGSFGRAIFRSASQAAVPNPAVLLTRGGSASQSLASLIAALAPDARGELAEAQQVIGRLEQEGREAERRAQEIDAALLEAQRGTASASMGEAMRAGRSALVADLEGARATLADRRERIAATHEEFNVGLIRMRAGIADASTLRATMESANRLLATRN